jgi:hypothetical protein
LETSSVSSGVSGWTLANPNNPEPNKKTYSIRIPLDSTGFKVFEVKIQSNRRNPEAKKRFSFMIPHD